MLPSKNNSPITFTIDLEDHLERYAPDGRWVTNTRKILGWCAEKKIRATFFAVGRVAAAAPQLLKDITAAGHELALHSYAHVPLTRENPETYGAKLAAAKAQFEALTGRAVLGFRAPVFSLTPTSAWVVDVLRAQGFTYSSSIIAGRGAVHGYQSASASAFLWANGLIELPVPVCDFGALALPYLGGVYLRYLPLGLVRMMERSANEALPLWTYTHPYDIDAGEGFVRMPDVPLWMNIILMHRRKGFLEKLARLLEDGAAPPLIERVAAPAFRAGLRSWQAAARV